MYEYSEKLNIFKCFIKNSADTIWKFCIARFNTYIWKTNVQFLFHFYFILFYFIILLFNVISHYYDEFPFWVIFLVLYYELTRESSHCQTGLNSQIDSNWLICPIYIYTEKSESIMGILNDTKQIHTKSIQIWILLENALDLI